MSFFKDFKDDLSQAVNELVTEEGLKNENSKIPEESDNDQAANTPDIAIEMKESEEETAVQPMTESIIEEPAAVKEPESHPETPVTASGDLYVESPAVMEDNEYNDEIAEITRATSIEGNITSEGSINLDGKVKGNVTCLGKLVVSGEIIGASKAAEIYTNNSRIMGDVTSDRSIKIGNGTVIIGNVYASSAVIGGAIKGDIDVKGPVVLDSSAVVQGNIKSRSMQINNGAVIEGMVSQCYADIDYQALFDDTFSK